jgi:ribosomal protein S18 acetylase RimI-like enzyme
MTDEIRPATLADLPAIREVLVTTWHATYDPIDGPEAVTRITDVWHAPDALRAQLNQPDSCFLVAETVNGHIVATSLARLGPDGNVNLSRLYILPDFQRGGLGSRMLAATLKPFASAKLVALEVAPENASAIAFYERHGFKQADHTQNCGKPGSGSAALIFHKTL